jgi:HD superfamily phosphohydrolase
VHYTDRVYGPANIDAPVLLDLFESNAVRRLDGVLQHGISSLLDITNRTSRLEHSIGVMLLVKRLGATLEEQIAALLHDISHTAFSHVIDYVFDGHDSQSYHEDKKEEFMAGSDLPVVLARHGYDWRTFLHEDDYPLLEQPSPALCADRLDYFLRDSRDLGLATTAEVQFALDHLVVHMGRIVVDDVGAAHWLADIYITADQMSWANFREVGLYELTARAIKTGLNIGAIDESDFWSTDDRLWAKLHAAGNAVLRAELELISVDTQFVWDEAAPTFRVSTKLRTIDPDVLQDGRLRMLSEIDPEFARRRAEYLDGKSGKWPMRVIPPAGMGS